MEYPFVPGLTGSWLYESEMIAFDQLVKKWGVTPNEIAYWINTLRQSWLRNPDNSNGYCPFRVYRILERRLDAGNQAIIEVSHSTGNTADHASPNSFVIHKCVEIEIERIKPEWSLNRVPERNAASGTRAQEQIQGAPKWSNWIGRDSWCAWEAAALLLCVEPEYFLARWRQKVQDATAGQSEIPIDADLLTWVIGAWELLQEMERSHHAGKLCLLSGNWPASLISSPANMNPGPFFLMSPDVFEAWREAGSAHILPRTFLEWAQDKGHEIPGELLPLLSQGVEKCAQVVGGEAETDAKHAEARQKRLPVTQKVAAVLCGVTEKQVGKWDQGVQRPDRYPGRHNLAVLSAWAETYKQGKLVSSAARAANHPSTAEDWMLENLSDDGSGDPAAVLEKHEQNQNRKRKL